MGVALTPPADINRMSNPNEDGRLVLSTHSFPIKNVKEELELYLVLRQILSDGR
jgi:hypothetical protein